VVREHGRGDKAHGWIVPARALLLLCAQQQCHCQLRRRGGRRVTECGRDGCHRILACLCLSLFSAVRARWFISSSRRVWGLALALASLHTACSLDCMPFICSRGRVRALYSFLSHRHSPSLSLPPHAVRSCGRRLHCLLNRFQSAQKGKKRRSDRTGTQAYCPFPFVHTTLYIMPLFLCLFGSQQRSPKSHRPV
jgi:hypothetical protein